MKKDNHSVKTGYSFGLTSAVITTLGLMIGLYEGTGSRLAVVGGILTIAIADAFSDSLGIHISEEAENVHTEKEIWISTFSTFLTKFFFALTFLIPALLFTLKTAMIVSVFWGLSLLGFLSFHISEKKKFKSMFEHLFIAIIVIVFSYLIGKFISYYFAG